MDNVGSNPAAVATLKRHLFYERRGEALFSKIAIRVSEFTGSPLAFFLACLAVIVWAVLGPMFDFSEVWQLVINTSTTIVTFLLVFLIQHSQNRDTNAMQKKLDELIHAIDKANDDVAGIEKKS